VLSERLVEIYKADRPDFVTVVLEADGFVELLERTELIRRLSRQDARIIALVRAAKADAKATTERLHRLAGRAERLAAAIEEERLQVASVNRQLVERRQGYMDARSAKSRALSSVRVDRRGLQAQLVALERENARVRAALRREMQRAAAPPSSDRGGTETAGPMRKGSGNLIWPIDGPITSPFGSRWGRLHAGLDIGAPEGTPIRVADSGKVVLAGPQGAYGNYTCVQHTGSLSTCYAHQSRIDTSVGATVSKGQVIGAVGNTGRSFGAHLHFETRTGGSPVDPLNYL
jgi:murein DD-endopeptidase MepM/ murein hydrolase activator NlpD